LRLRHRASIARARLFRNFACISELRSKGYEIETSKGKDNYASRITGSNLSNAAQPRWQQRESIIQLRPTGGGGIRCIKKSKTPPVRTEPAAQN
jgi:hypothetical protein